MGGLQQPLDVTRQMRANGGVVNTHLQGFRLLIVHSGSSAGRKRAATGERKSATVAGNCRRHRQVFKTGVGEKGKK